MAFPGDWAFKQKITIDSTKVPTDNQSDFSVFIHRSQLHANVVDPSGGANVTSQTDGGDIRFSSDAAGTTQLPCDVIVWDHDVSTGSGELRQLAAVKVPTVSASADTDIYIWFGTSGSDTQPADSDTYGSDNAYDGNWKGLWPLIADGDDRTSFDNLLTLSGTPGYGGTGPQGLPCIDLDGSTQWGKSTISFPTANPLTMIGWGEPNNDTADHCLLSVSDTAGGNDYWHLTFAGAATADRTITFSRGASTNGQAVGPTLFTANTMMMAAGVHESGDASRTVYLDAANPGTNTTAGVTPAGIDGIGVGVWAKNINAWPFNGALAMVSLHTIARSANWLTTHFNNVDGYAAFAAANTPEANSSGPTIPIIVHHIYQMQG